MGNRASCKGAHAPQTTASALTRRKDFLAPVPVVVSSENHAQSIPSILGSFHLRFGDGLGCPSPNRKYRDHGRSPSLRLVASANLTRTRRTGRTRPATSTEEPTAWVAPPSA